MAEILKTCPLCNSGQFHLAYTIKDFSVSGEEFSIQSCENCTLMFTSPRPAEHQIAPYYATELYISHKDEGNSLINRVYKQVRRITMSQKVDLLNKAIPNKGKILDIGCGTGYFLDSMEAAGWHIAGVEVDDGARKLAEQRLNIKIENNLLAMNFEQYKTITMWHVLEHIHKLNESMLKITDMLEDNGRLIVALPNWKSNDAQYYKEYWAAWDVPRHLYHFSPESVAELASKYSLTVQDILPMKFDSYYVSLLSEQYKGGSILRYPKAVIKGLSSNLKAASSGQYSSLIYVLKKQNA
jgi:2-polyprenyl-3-methyl-5-hydroxy-6-metoxy-1,4-benzoquinol methylase